MEKFLSASGLSKVLTAVRSWIADAVKALKGADGKLLNSLLPVATTSAIGAVKAGTGIAIAADGTLSATGTAAVDPSALPAATATALGAVKIGDGITLGTGGVISVTHPTKLSAFTNDSKYQTESQVAATAEAKAAAAVAAVVDGAPTAFDTLKEIAAYLTDDTVANGLVKQLDGKMNANDLVALTDAEIEAILAA